MSARPGSRTATPADADDLRVEQIAAQLEETEQQRLTDYWIEGATRAQAHSRPHSPAGPKPRSVAPEINHGSEAKCVEEPVGSSTHEPMAYDPKGIHGKETI